MVEGGFPHHWGLFGWVYWPDLLVRKLTQVEVFIGTDGVNK